jgi:propane monooxygenase reductase subunit
MVDAAIGLLEMHGVTREHIHYDKFTTSVAE